MRTRTTLAAVSIAVLAASFMSACTPASEKNTDASPSASLDISAIKVDDAARALLPAEVASAGKLVVGVDPTYAPNEFKDANGKPIGWEIDMIDAAAAKLGLTTDYRVATFDNIVPSILGDKYDLGLGGYYDTKKRQETLDMIDFFKAGNQFASPADKPITTELDVCGLKVGAQNGGSAIATYLPSLQTKCKDAGKGAITVLGYDTQDAQTAALNLGQVEAMVSDSPVTSYAVKLSDGKLVGSPIFDTTLSGTPVKKGRDGLTKALQAALQSMLDDGTYKQILTNWGVEAGSIDKITVNGATE